MTQKVGSNPPLQQQLCLEQWCSRSCARKSCTYELFSIVAHVGSAAQGGHYTAYIRAPYCSQFQDVALRAEREWLHCDDESLRFLSSQEVEDCFASNDESLYILFYRCLDA